MEEIKNSDYAALYQDLKYYENRLRTMERLPKQDMGRKIKKHKTDQKTDAQKLDDAKASVMESLYDVQNSPLTQTKSHPFGPLRSCPAAGKPLRELYHFMREEHAKGRLCPSEWEKGPGPGLLERFIEATRPRSSESGVRQQEDDVAEGSSDEKGKLRLQLCSKAEFMLTRVT